MKFDFSGAQKGEEPPEDGLNWDRLLWSGIFSFEKREKSLIFQEEKGV